MVIDGRIFRGGSGGAGELGMTLIGLACDPDVPAATEHFPQPGSLEALASGTALDRFAQGCRRRASRLGPGQASGREQAGAGP